MADAKPVRLQLSRKHGFRLQETSLALNGLPAVNVARPSKWGNPWAIKGVRRWLASIGVEETFSDEERSENCVYNYRLWMVKGLPVTMPRDHLLASLPALHGKNLACWCDPWAPCHADVLLEIANSVEPT